MKVKEVVLLVVLVVVIAGGSIWFVQQQEDQHVLEEQVSQFAREKQVLQAELEKVQEELTRKEEPIIVEKQVVVEKIVEREVKPVLKSQRYPILAYSRSGEKGVVGFVEVSLVPGKGGILIDVEPFNALAVQLSAKNAVRSALRELGKHTLGEEDVKIKFDIDARAVGGESAGLAIGIATVALLSDKKVKEYVAATGTLDEQGNVGKVGGILAKAEAVSERGVRELLIPRGEGEITALTPHYFVDPNTGKVVRKGEPVLRKINVIQEARRRWDIEVHQVATLNQALKYALH